MKSEQKITPIILAGGVSKRLFPLCDEEKPKQFLKLKNGLNLFQETLVRNNSALYASPIILTQKRYKKKIEKSLSELKIDKYDIILEPSARNTLPSIYIACLYLEKLGKSDAICAFLPSDHLITKKSNYQYSLKKISEQIDKQIILIGITPEKDNNQYGYIEYIKSDSDFSKIKKFIEKPKDISVLKNKQNLLWNSGIYIARADIIKKEIEKYNSKLCKKIQKIFATSTLRKNELSIAESFENIESISIDYGISQQSRILCVYHKKPLGWQDLGSFEALKKNKLYFGESLVKN